MNLDDALKDLSSRYEKARWEPAFQKYFADAREPETKAALLCRAARYYFAIRDVVRYTELASEAQVLARKQPALRAHVTVLKAYAACTTNDTPQSDELLASLETTVIPRNLMAWALAIRGRNELNRGNFTLAIEHSQDALAVDDPDTSVAGFATMTLAYSFDAMLRGEEALRYATLHLEYCLATEWKPWIATAHTFVASMALGSNKNDLARIHRDAALAMTEGDPSAGNAGALSQTPSWLAHMELKLEGPTQALPHALLALRIAEDSRNAVWVASAQILLGRILAAMEQHESALEYYTAAFTMELKLADVPRMTLYRNMATTLRELGRRDETAEICWKLWQLQRDFDTRTHSALLNYQLRLEDKIHRQKLELLRLRADQLERELSHTASQLIARTELLTKFRDEIQGILRTGTDPAATIRGIRDKLKGLPVEEMNWTTFDAQFMSVHPEFTSNLLSRYPDLSQAEVRLCKLLRLNLTSSEIARLFSLSERTIETQRFAVRKKLGLKRSENVADALATI